MFTEGTKVYRRKVRFTEGTGMFTERTKIYRRNCKVHRRTSSYISYSGNTTFSINEILI